MAFFDDPKILIGHLRHSFITSDDTGMCELIMVNEDLDKEIKSDNTFSKRSLKFAQRFKILDKFPRHAAQSVDIQASPTLSSRPPMKNMANIFEKAEQRKRRRADIKTITWKDDEDACKFDPSVFPHKEIVPRAARKTQSSTLAALLNEYDKRSANPFFEYSRFNGDNHGIGVSNTYRIFLPMTKEPHKPITVTILHNATVTDLIGLTFWKYIEERRGPPVFKDVSKYSVMIAEEDADIDTDLPALDRDDRIAKFRFRYLGIVEDTTRLILDEVRQAQPKHVVVRVYYGQGGFSTLAVESVDIDMGEVLSRVIRKRRLQMQGYELERKDNPGVPVDMSSTLRSQGTLDFVLIKNISRKEHRRSSSPSTFTATGTDGSSSSSQKKGDRVQTSVRAELTSHQYRSYRVSQLHKMRSNTDVLLGVSGERLEVDPVSQNKSGFFGRPAKPTTYGIKRICACEVLEERSNQRTVFRIVRSSKDGGFKNIDFEAPTAEAKEIVQKMGLILEGLNTTAKADYRSRKGSRT